MSSPPSPAVEERSAEALDAPPGLPMPAPGSPPQSPHAASDCESTGSSSLGFEAQKPPQALRSLCQAPQVTAPPGLGCRIASGRQVSAPPGLSPTEPRFVPLGGCVRRQVSESVPEPEPELKAETAEAAVAPVKRFCVWCGKQVAPKLLSAKFCVFCGKVWSGDEVGGEPPRPGRPQKPALPKADHQASVALAEKARRKVAQALAEKNAMMTALWQENQAACFGASYFGQDLDGAEDLSGGMTGGDQPAFLSQLSLGSSAWGEEAAWGSRWGRAITEPAQIQYTNAGITPAMLYQMQSNWN